MHIYGKNPISDLVGYFTTACKQALLRNCSQRLRPVATSCNFSRAVDDVKFWLLRVALRYFSLLRVQSKRTFIISFITVPYAVVLARLRTGPQIDGNLCGIVTDALCNYSLKREVFRLPQRFETGAFTVRAVFKN